MKNTAGRCCGFKKGVRGVQGVAGVQGEEPGARIQDPGGAGSVKATDGTAFFWANSILGSGTLATDYRSLQGGALFSLQ